MARGLGSLGQEPPHVVQVRPEIVRRLEVGQHHARVAAEDVRRIGGKVRAEDQHAVAGVQERLAEQLLEILRARAGNDVLAGHRQPVLAIAHIRPPPRGTP